MLQGGPLLLYQKRSIFIIIISAEQDRFFRNLKETLAYSDAHDSAFLSSLLAFFFNVFKVDTGHKMPLAD